MKAFHGRLSGRLFLLGLPVAAGLCLFFVLAEIKAQPPNAAQAAEARGSVQRMTTAPRGEIDGAVLDNGTVLHWPPHMQDRFANLIKQGDQVRATGRTETGPAGDTHFEIQTVTDLRTNATAENPDFANGPPHPGRGPRERGRRMRPPVGRDVALAPDARNQSSAVEVRGAVQRMTTAPRGEIDGAVLDNGTVLHWPPHMQDRFAAAIKVGDQVRAIGRTETGPAGDVHFEVQSITNAGTNATVANPDPAGGPAGAVQPIIPNSAIDLEQRLRDLSNQVEQLRREVAELRGSKK
jgi:hypothetical protein